MVTGPLSIVVTVDRATLVLESMAVARHPTGNGTGHSGLSMRRGAPLTAMPSYASVVGAIRDGHEAWGLEVYTHTNDETQLDALNRLHDLFDQVGN